MLVVVAMSLLLSSRQNTPTTAIAGDAGTVKRRYPAASGSVSPPLTLSRSPSSAVSTLDWGSTAASTTAAMGGGESGDGVSSGYDAVRVQQKTAAVFRTTRRWILWTLSFSLFFAVTWTLGFLSVSSPPSVPAGGGGLAAQRALRSWRATTRPMSACFAVCEVLLGVFALLLTTMLAGKVKDKTTFIIN